MHLCNWLLLIHTNLDFSIKYNAIIDLTFILYLFIHKISLEAIFNVGEFRKYDGHGKKNSTKC
jgi:hypothetical protein